METSRVGSDPLGLRPMYDTSGAGAVLPSGRSGTSLRVPVPTSRASALPSAAVTRKYLDTVAVIVIVVSPGRQSVWTLAVPTAGCLVRDTYL